MSQLRVTLIILLGLASLSCSSNSNNMGYWEADKPWRGTVEANKFNKNPYWQCVKNCDE